MNHFENEYFKYEVVNGINHIVVYQATRESVDAQLEIYEQLSGTSYTLIDYSGSGIPPIRYGVNQTVKAMLTSSRLREMFMHTAVVLPEDSLINMAKIIVQQTRVFEYVRLFSSHEIDTAWEWIASLQQSVIAS